MRVWKNDLCHIIKLYRRSGFESRQMHKEYSLLLLTKTKQSASVGQGDLFVDPWLTSYEMRMISTLRNTPCTVKNSILSINLFVIYTIYTPPWVLLFIFPCICIAFEKS
uniref:Uncharacterized protein n=1 Tax=Cacopsylla melanoneura TaxID=428564 RepID=A0A8D8QSQ1_9HEMI